MKILNILSWIWAGVVLLFGLMMMATNVIAAIAIIIFSVMLAPNVKRFIHHQITRHKIFIIRLRLVGIADNFCYNA